MNFDVSYTFDTIIINILRMYLTSVYNCQVQTM